VRIEESQSNIVELSDIRRKRQRALSPYGPLKVGLITWQSQETHTASQLAQLSELLSSLESVVESLNYKSFTAYDTLASATENLRAELLPFINDTTGTEDML
jgi:hypothetical protein